MSVELSLDAQEDSLRMQVVLLRSALLALRLYGGWMDLFFAVRLYAMLSAYLRRHKLNTCLSCCSIKDCNPASVELKLAAMLGVVIKRYEGIRPSWIGDKIKTMLKRFKGIFEERAMFFDMACDTEETLTELCTAVSAASFSREEVEAWAS